MIWRSWWTAECCFVPYLIWMTLHHSSADDGSKQVLCCADVRAAVHARLNPFVVDSDSPYTAECWNWFGKWSPELGPVRDTAVPIKWLPRMDRGTVWRWARHKFDIVWTGLGGSPSRRNCKSYWAEIPVCVFNLHINLLPPNGSRNNLLALSNFPCDWLDKNSLRALPGNKLSGSIPDMELLPLSILALSENKFTGRNMLMSPTLWTSTLGSSLEEL